MGRVIDLWAGEIAHALRFTVQRTRRAYVWPATHFASASTDTNRPPMGMRFRLKASVNIDSLPPIPKAIAQAMKTYGLILADNGSDMYITGTHDTRWNNDVLNPAFRSLRADDFEVVQLGWEPPVRPVPTPKRRSARK